MKALLVTPPLISASGWGRYSLSVIEKLKLKKDIELVIKSDSQELLPLTSLFSFIYNLLEIRRTTKNVDIVHAFDGWPYGVYGYVGVLGTRKKLFITAVGTYSVAPLQSLIKGFLLRLAYKRAQMVFCISNYTKNRIIEKVKVKRISTVYMGNKSIDDLPPDVINVYKEKYNLNNRYPILLTTGAIKYRKGQLDVVRAINLLKKEYPSILYIMAGQTTNASYFNNILSFVKGENIENNIRVIDNAKDDLVIRALYELCDIFILTSNNGKNGHFEGFGLVLLEAAGAGKPVIGSRDCGIEDALEDGYNGYLVEQGNPIDIKEKIKKVLSNDIIDFRENSKEFAGRFSWDKTVNLYVKYYEGREILNKNN